MTLNIKPAPNARHHGVANTQTTLGVLAAKILKVHGGIWQRQTVPLAPRLADIPEDRFVRRPRIFRVLGCYVEMIRAEHAGSLHHQTHRGFLVRGQCRLSLKAT